MTAAIDSLCRTDSFMHHNTRLIALCLCVLALAGCASNKPDIKPAHTESQRVAAARSLYEKAHKQLINERFKVALQDYNALEDNFPFTRFAVQGQIDSIYAHYRNGDAEVALAEADQFIKEHPTYPQLDYVYYLKGLVNFRRSADEGHSMLPIDEARRDMNYTRQAFDDFALLIKAFPNSKYDHDARQRMIFLRDRLARHDLYIAGYYMDRGAWIAANRRAQLIIRHFQGTRAVPRALLIMVKSYRKLGLKQSAADSRKMLVANYPAFAKAHHGELE